MPSTFGKLLILSALLCGSLDALDPARAITQYSHEVWDTESGLPTNSIFAIAQTRDGFLWFGSGAGLARFDGIEFQVFVQGGANALPANDITTLLDDGAGGLWIGLNGGLSHFRDGRFRNYAAADGLANDRILSLARDEQGVVWVGTRRGLFQVRGDKVLKQETPGATPPGPEIWSLAAAPGGTLWIGSKVGLHALRNGQFTHYPNGEPPPGNSIRALAIEPQGAVLAASTRWLASFHDGEFGANLQPPHTPLDRVTRLLRDGDGNLWIASSALGLFRMRDGVVSRYGKDDGLRSDQVASLFLDREKNLWVGTRGGGLHRFRDTAVLPFGPSEGLSGQIVETVQERSGGGLWVGVSDGGLDIIENNRVRPFAGASVLHDSPLASIADDGGGGIWVGTKDGYVRHLGADGRGGEEIKAAQSTQWAQDLHFDPQRCLWIGMAGAGLLSWDKGQLTRYTVKEGLPSNFILAVEDDPAGGLWLGAYLGGLVHFRDGKSSTVLSKKNGLLSADIVSLYVDRQGAIWAGGNDTGLIRWKDGRATIFNKDRGLFDNSAFQILEDDSGYLWIGCNRGIYRVSKAELDAGGSVQSLAFGVADGMRSAECNANFRPSGWKTRDGKLWFATARGVVAIDPARLRRNALPPPVAITEVLADNKALPDFSRVQLRPETQGFEIRYAGLSFAEPKRNRYRYRLDPFDRNWVEAGARRSASYSNLPPGNYRFQVLASNNDGVWSEQPAVLNLTLQPRWYQTTWAALLGLSLVVLTALGFHVYRMRQMQQRLALVMAERTRIARELHDTLLQGFSGMILHLEAVGNRMVETPHESRQQLSGILSRMEKYLDDARGSIAALRRSPADSGTLPARLEYILRQQTESADVTAECQVFGAPRALPESVESNLYRIALEAMVNAMRHSHCRKLQVTIEYQPKTVRLRVRDDGQGFAPEAVASLEGEHFGLRGMRERAADVHADLQIQSQPGAGCTIVVTVSQ